MEGCEVIRCKEPDWLCVSLETTLDMSQSLPSLPFLYICVCSCWTVTQTEEESNGASFITALDTILSIGHFLILAFPLS